MDLQSLHSRVPHAEKRTTILFVSVPIESFQTSQAQKLADAQKCAAALMSNSQIINQFR